MSLMRGRVIFNAKHSFWIRAFYRKENQIHKGWCKYRSTSCHAVLATSTTICALQGECCAPVRSLGAGTLARETAGGPFAARRRAALSASYLGDTDAVILSIQASTRISPTARLVLSFGAWVMLRYILEHLRPANLATRKDVWRRKWDTRARIGNTRVMRSCCPWVYREMCDNEEKGQARRHERPMKIIVKPRAVITYICYNYIAETSFFLSFSFYIASWSCMACRAATNKATVQVKNRSENDIWTTV